MSKIFCLICSSMFLLAAVPALAAPSSSTHECGKYHYSVTRVVDGFSITVKDGTRTRGIFYPNIYSSDSGWTRPLSEVVSRCSGNSLIIADYSLGRYWQGTELNLLDPTQNKLSFQMVAGLTVPAVGHANATSTTGEYDKYSELFTAPVDGLSINAPKLVNKIRIAGQNDILNDRSYYVFGGSGIVRRQADSNWNTTLAREAAYCPDGTSYVLYEKQFAKENAKDSKFPASQFVIERVSKGVRKLIPVPYSDNFWKYPGAGLKISFKGCYGGNMVLGVRDAYFWTVLEDRRPFDSMTMLTDKTLYADYLNPKKALTSYVSDLIRYDGANYSQDGYLERVTQGIEGSAAIRTLLADGSIMVTSPRYFKSLLTYPKGSSLSFSKYPLDRTKIVVEFTPEARSKSEYYIDENGKYVDADVAGVRTVIPDKTVEGFNDFTPFYIANINEGLALKSYFVPKGLLLHGVGNKKYQLNWQRVGPLEKDGTRKVWYSITLGGKQQTWLATIR